MRVPKKRLTEKLRPWRAAPDEKSAKAAAIAEYKIGEDMRPALQGIATAPRDISSNVRPR